jgi:hypothetical protein
MCQREMRMRRALLTVLLGLSMASVVSCDGYTYQGRNGQENRALAETMLLPEAYTFYIETYKSVSPPMLDVAPTFRRFGSQGTTYIVEKAIGTTDVEEFEAALTALLVLDYRCPADVAEAFATKGQQLSTNVTVSQVCYHRI